MTIKNGLYKRRNIFQIINEAPEDGAAGDAGNDAGAEEAPAAGSGDTDPNADDASDDTGGDEDTTDMGNDEDFDVDTNIDDGGDGDPDSTEGDDTGGDLGGDSGGGGLDGGSEEEVNPKNTNIFSTLSKEEQAIKIGELKKKFNELYIYINDMYGKINDINPDEDNIEAIYRVTSGLYSLKDYVGDYIKTIFPMKSYIENDISYSLSNLNSSFSSVVLYLIVKYL